MFLRSAFIIGKEADCAATNTRIHLYPSYDRMFLPMSPTTAAIIRIKYKKKKNVHEKEGDSESAANRTKCNS